MAAERCNEAAAGRYRIDIVFLPKDASQQREQLVRRRLPTTVSPVPPAGTS